MFLPDSTVPMYIKAGKIIPILEIEDDCLSLA